MLLVYWEPQVQKLQLTIIAVEHISPRSSLLACAAHVLSQTIERLAFFGISLGIVAVGIADISLERGHPVNLVCSLERHRDHR